MDDEAIRIAIEESYELVASNFPQFYLDIKRHSRELLYRLKIWVSRSESTFLRMLNNGISFDTAIAEILPWRVEVPLFSKRLGLRGRADRIYNNGHKLEPEDIKTHDFKFKTLLQGQSNQIQLLCYSVMAEEQYAIPSDENRIFFSRDLTYIEYDVTPSSRLELEQLIIKTRKVLSNQELPPVLQDELKIKCDFCYMRQLCFQKEHQNEEDWLDRLMAKNESDIDKHNTIFLGN